MIKESYSKITIIYINKDWIQYKFSKKGKSRTFRISNSLNSGLGQSPYGKLYEIKKYQGKTKRIKVLYLTYKLENPPMINYFELGAKFRHLEESKLKVEIEFQYK